MNARENKDYVLVSLFITTWRQIRGRSVNVNGADPAVHGMYWKERDLRHDDAGLRPGPSNCRRGESGLVAEHVAALHRRRREPLLLRHHLGLFRIPSYAGVMICTPYSLNTSRMFLCSAV